MAEVKKRGTRRISVGRILTGKRRRKKTSIRQLQFLFWLVFFAVVFVLFAVNWEKIQHTVSNSVIFEKFFSKEPEENPYEKNAVEIFPAAGTQISGLTFEFSPDEQTQSGTQNVNQQEQAAAENNSSFEETVQTASAAFRERSLYLLKIDAGGDVFWHKAARPLEVSGSPMVDVLNSLLAGPTTEEKDNGIVSLIPASSRVISASVQDGTAFINFNDDFQFNTYGSEGCAAAIRQIVWTVTEFPNVEDVQILIDGKKLDHIGGSVSGEGIWIGSPINRSF